MTKFSPDSVAFKLRDFVSSLETVLSTYCMRSTVLGAEEHHSKEQEGKEEVQEEGGFKKRKRKKKQTLLSSSLGLNGKCHHYLTKLLPK